MTDRRRTAVWVGIALVGLVLAAALTTAAAQLSNQRVGLSSEPLTAGDKLAPAVSAPAAARTAKPRATRTPRPKQTATPAPAFTAAPAPARTSAPAPTRTAAPATGGHGSDDGPGDDHRGRGRGADD